MASNLKSTQATEKQTVMSPSGANDVFQCYADYTMTAALVINDIIEMLPLPADCVLIDMIVDMPSLDTSTGVVWDAGLLSGAWLDAGARTLAATYVSGSVVGRSSTGGIVRPTVAGYTKTASSTTDRSIGIKITTAATGTAATSGTIRMTATFRPIRDAG